MMPPLDPKTLSDYKRYEQEHKISAQVSKYVGMFGNVASVTGALVALLYAIEQQNEAALGMVVFMVLALMFGRAGYKTYHDHMRVAAHARQIIKSGKVK